MILVPILLALAAQQPERPNILWITSEDHGPHLGCYGCPDADTPNLDALAAAGMRWERVWSNAPVCAPARTALITGVWPPSVGAHDMRTLVAPPPWLRFFPQLLREAGWYCTNNKKEDYNLAAPGRVWDESSRRAHWRNRPPGRPFFAVFNLAVTHESRIRQRPHEFRHDPATVRVPAFHPDLPEVRRDWAQYHDQIGLLDRRVGALLAELEADGLAEDTIVFFFSDHGPGLSRCKRWPYDSGLRVPLIVRIPPRWRALAPPGWREGGASSRLVQFLDLAPTVLSLAGIEPPAWMHGRAFLGPYRAEPLPYLYGFRNRMDERSDLVRSLCDGRFVYIRNEMPWLPQGQFLAYENQTPTYRAWRAAWQAGGLPPHLARFWEPKPREELYDLRADPDEVVNLAAVPGHERELARLRAALDDWLLRTNDLGYLPEPRLHALGPAAADYPLAEILALLHRGEAAAAASDDPAYLWWRAQLALHGETPPPPAELRRLAAHADPNVRLLGLEELARRGEEADRAAAVPAILALADPVAGDPWLALAAWNALDRLGPLAAPWREEIAALPVAGPSIPPRIAPNFAKLREHLLAGLRD